MVKKENTDNLVSVIYLGEIIPLLKLEKVKRKNNCYYMNEHDKNNTSLKL